MSVKHKFIRVYFSSAKMFNLSPAELNLIYLIMSLSNKKGYCYARKDTLAEILNISANAVYSNLRKLKNKKLIFSKKLGRSKAQLFVTEKWKYHIAIIRGENEPPPNNTNETVISDSWYSND